MNAELLVVTGRSSPVGRDWSILASKCFPEQLSSSRLSKTAMMFTKSWIGSATRISAGVVLLKGSPFMLLASRRLWSVGVGIVRYWTDVVLE